MNLKQLNTERKHAWENTVKRKNRQRGKIDVILQVKFEKEDFILSCLLTRQSSLFTSKTTFPPFHSREKTSDKSTWWWLQLFNRISSATTSLSHHIEWWKTCIDWVKTNSPLPQKMCIWCKTAERQRCLISEGLSCGGVSFATKIDSLSSEII